MKGLTLRAAWVDELAAVPTTALVEGEVRVLLAGATLTGREHEASLEDAERSAIGAMRSDVGRRSVRTARVLLRHALGPLLGVEPHQVVLRRRCHACGGAHGAIAVHGHSIQVSISHPSGLTAVALHEGDPVGVDIEVVTRAFSERALGAQVLSSVEAARGAVSAHELAMMWTRKEAILKASGYGLSIPPTALTLASGKGQIGVQAGLDGRDAQCWLHDVVEQHLSDRAAVAAVAVVPPEQRKPTASSRWTRRRDCCTDS